MNPIIKSTELLIFDLDGTLYEDTDHFDYFASLLQKELPVDKQHKFSETYRKMKVGQHPVEIGTAYDAARDTVISIDPMTEKAIAVKDWDGRVWNHAEVQTTYPNKLAFDFENIIAIGDGWWLPQAAARHFGIPGAEAQDCYRKTKEFMATDQFQLTKIAGLKEGLNDLRGPKQLVLVTNSEPEDVARLLKELDLENKFDEIIPSAFKPAHTKKHFNDLLNRYRIEPEKAVSIGDNFINEIAPALALGMKAVYIHPHEKKKQSTDLIVVRSLTEIFHDEK